MIAQLVFKQIMPIESMPTSLNVFASDYQENLEKKNRQQSVEEANNEESAKRQQEVSQHEKV